MNTNYVVKVTYDVKGELKHDPKYEPTVWDLKQKFQDYLDGMTKYYDRLTWWSMDADITAKIVLEKLPQWFVWSIVLSVDGTKHMFPVSIDNDTPLDNSQQLIHELTKKLTHQINNKLI